MGRRNTRPKSYLQVFQWPIRSRALIQQNTALFRFYWVQPKGSDLLSKHYRNKRLVGCCIDLLNWQGLSKCGNPKVLAGLILTSGKSFCIRWVRRSRIFGDYVPESDLPPNSAHVIIRYLNR